MMPYITYISIGGLIGFTLGMGSCVFTHGDHLPIIGLTAFGGLVGGVIKFVKTKVAK